MPHQRVRLWMSYGQAGSNPKVRVADNPRMAWFAVSVSVSYRVSNSRTVEIFQSDIACLANEEQSSIAAAPYTA